MPTVSLTPEYLMTMHAVLDPPRQIDNTLMVFNVREGGWVRGPAIEGRLVPPGGDWARVMPGGNLRLDVRATLETTDGALLQLRYHGVISFSEATLGRFMAGEKLGPEDCYFITAPLVQTSAPRYAWLNHVQCVGRMVELQLGTDPHVVYDIFVMR